MRLDFANRTALVTGAAQGIGRAIAETLRAAGANVHLVDIAPIAWDAERAFVVSSEDGLDELSTSGTTKIHEVSGGTVSVWETSPEDVGLTRATPESVAGSGPEENAAVTRAILSGEKGAPRDLAVLNAGAAIMVAGDGDDLAACVRTAEEAVDSGAAAAVLDALVRFTSERAS